MKTNAIAAAVALAILTGCSTTNQVGQKEGTTPVINPGTQQAISEQRVVNDFKRQGVRVIYSLTGNLEAIEVVGYAPIWGASQNAIRESYRVAELEAKKAMNDFINKETITSSVSVAMTSRNLERARDNKNNNFATNRGRDEVASLAEDEEFADDKPTGREENAAIRNDAVNIASRVNTAITVRNAGILSGMYLVEGEVVNNGRTVKATYRWDQKHAQARTSVRNLMMQ